MDADALLHPRGPLPPGVYWRRRGVTAAVVVVALFLVLQTCGGGSDGTTLTTGSSSTTPSPGGSAVTRTSGPSAAPSLRPSPTSPPSPTRGNGAPCRDTDLAVTATASAREYAAGVRPRLTLVVTNRAPVSCTRDLGAALRELRVVSGSDRVWSSDDCAPGGEAEMVTLPAGGSRSFSVTWSRTRSRPGCPAGREAVPPGTYRVVGRLGKIEQPGDVFALRT